MIQHGPRGSVLTVTQLAATLRDPAGGVILQEQTSDGKALPRFCFSPDRSRLALNDRDRLKIYDTRTGDMVREFAVEQSVSCSCWLARSEEVLFFDTNGAHVVNVDSGGEPSLEDLPRGVPSPGPDGESVVIASAGGAKVCRRVDGEWRIHRSLAVAQASCAVFSPDGERVFVGQVDGRILLFRGDGKLVKSLSGHSNQVRAIVFSPDQTMFASASHDGTARLWTIDGDPIAVLEGPLGAVIDCSFTPDGRQLWTANREDQTVRKWFVYDSDLLEAARNRVSRKLTAAERERFAELIGR